MVELPPSNPVCPMCLGPREYRKKYCPACAIKSRKETAKKYRETSKGKETFKRSLIEGRYNLTMEQYNEMVLSQNGVCALCKVSKELTVDHDHKCCSGIESCGKCVRGLLCGKCNRGLGMFDDNPELLKLALEYLGTYSNDYNELQ